VSALQLATVYSRGELFEQFKLQWNGCIWPHSTWHHFAVLHPQIKHATIELLNPETTQNEK